jgi:hypothetical protein
VLISSGLPTCAHPDTGARCAGPAAVRRSPARGAVCWQQLQPTKLGCHRCSLLPRCHWVQQHEIEQVGGALLAKRRCWHGGHTAPPISNHLPSPLPPPPSPWQSERSATASHGLVARLHSSGRWVHAVAWGLGAWPPVHAPSTSPRTQVASSIMLIFVVCGGGAACWRRGDAAGCVRTPPHATPS